MEFLKYLISLLVIVDPLMAAVVVSGVVEPKEVKVVAFKSSLTFFLASFVTVVLGDTLLKLLGINVFSIKIFGGLILLQMAFQMLQAKFPKTKHTEEETKAATLKEDVSIIPIGIPLLFGPGAFTTLLIFKGEAERASDYLFLFLSICITAAFVYLVLRNSFLISRSFGVTGMNVLVRIFGLFIGALGSQFIVDGVKHLWIEG